MAEAGVYALLGHLGYDPDTEGLVDTPARVVRAYEELTRGTRLDPSRHLARVFHDNATDHDEVIVVTGIDYVAVCEHHLLPFPGTAAVAYKPAPGAPVVGLSKLARVVDEYAARLTMQERITRQVTDALDKHLSTEGSACVLRSRHMCMGIRGVRKPNAEMVTSSLTGIFRDVPSARDEFLTLAKG
jgi:GTP cyclohydrolase I